MSLVINTELGAITLMLQPDAAPETCAYIQRLVGHKLYDGATFYRSDFVIQERTLPLPCHIAPAVSPAAAAPPHSTCTSRCPCADVHRATPMQMGTHGLGRTNPEGDLKVNETATHRKISNVRGTAAIAHWDVPDCGNSEFFINLGANTHLDAACACNAAPCEEHRTRANAHAYLKGAPTNDPAARRWRLLRLRTDRPRRQRIVPDSRCHRGSNQVQRKGQHHLRHRTVSRYPAAPVSHAPWRGQEKGVADA